MECVCVCVFHKYIIFCSPSLFFLFISFFKNVLLFSSSPNHPPFSLLPLHLSFFLSLFHSFVFLSNLLFASFVSVLTVLSSLSLSLSSLPLIAQTTLCTASSSLPHLETKRTKFTSVRFVVADCSLHFWQIMFCLFSFSLFICTNNKTLKHKTLKEWTELCWSDLIKPRKVMKANNNFKCMNEERNQRQTVELIQKTQEEFSHNIWNSILFFIPQMNSEWF